MEAKHVDLLIFNYHMLLQDNRSVQRNIELLKKTIIDIIGGVSSAEKREQLTRSLCKAQEAADGR